MSGVSKFNLLCVRAKVDKARDKHDRQFDTGNPFHRLNSSNANHDVTISREVQSMLQVSSKISYWKAEKGRILIWTLSHAKVIYF